MLRLFSPVKTEIVAAVTRVVKRSKRGHLVDSAKLNIALRNCYDHLIKGELFNFAPIQRALKKIPGISDSDCSMIEGDLKSELERMGIHTMETEAEPALLREAARFRTTPSRPRPPKLGELLLKHELISSEQLA